MEATKQPSARTVRLAIPLAYLALAIALTWPATATFTSKLGGDFGDGFQNLWNFWWFKEALIHLKNPFFTDHLRAPFGVSLVFQTFVVPDAIVALPLWLVLPPLGVYNAVILWSFVLTGLGMYALVHDWTGSRLAGFFAGAAFMATPFHMAHALGHQHLVSLGYLPLYLMFLHRMVRGGTTRDAVLGGLSLAAAALCSWYQLIFAFGWSLGVFGWALVVKRQEFLSQRFLKQAFTLAGVFLVITGPLMLAMYLTAKGEPIVGSHDARWYSADLESFFYPNARSAWAAVSHRWQRWTGNSAENGDYLGYGLMLLALVGAWRSSLGRAYLITGTIGALLSLGPGLHQAGQISHLGEMPYAKLVQLIPGLDFSGVPVRFGLMAQGALVILAGFGLAEVLGRMKKLGNQFGLTATCTVIALVEFWPQSLPTSVWPVPAPMLEWAKSSEDFTVLDLTGDTRMLWNAIHHGKRCVGGYVTRAPKRLDDWWSNHPIFSKLGKRPEHERLRLTRDDPKIDFSWGQESPAPEVFADLFRVHWEGAFEAPRDGEYAFYLSSDDGAVLQVDDRQVAQSRGPARGRTPPIALSAGVHRLKLDYQEVYGNAEVHLEWSGPGLDRQVLMPVSDTAGAPPAFHGQYFDYRVETGLPRDEAIKQLQELGLRYIAVGVQGDSREPLFEGDLGLKSIWFGDGIRIYEVPPRS